MIAILAALTLGWNPNPEPDISHYVLRYRTADTPPVEVNVGNTTRYRIDTLQEGETYFFDLRAVNTAQLISDPSDEISHTVPAGPRLLPRSGWTVTVSSEESSLVRGNIIDGDATTYWRSRHSPVPATPPHVVMIDFGEPKRVSGFRYLPRQTESTSGDLSQFEWESSDNSVDWTSRASGVRPAGKELFDVPHPPVLCRYVRLRWLDTDAGSCAELWVLTGVPETVTLHMQSSINMQTWKNLHTMEVPKVEKEFFRIKVETK